MLQRRKMQLNTQNSLHNFMQADFIDDKIAEAKCKIKYNTAMQDLTSMNPNKLCGPIFIGTPPSAELQNPVASQASNSRLQFFTKALDEPQRLPVQNVFSLGEAQTTFAEILHQILANPHLLNDLVIPIEAFKELYELANNNEKIAPTEFFQKLQQLAEKTIRQLLKSRGFKPRAVDFLTDASAAILPQMAKYTAKKYLEFAKAYEDAADFVQKQNLEMAHFLDEKTDGEAALALTKGHFSRYAFNPEMGLSHASKVRVNAIELSLGANIKSELARSNLENFFGKIAIAGIEFAKRSGLESMCNESGKVFDRQLEINTHFKILVQEKYAQITATKNTVALKTAADLQASNPEPAPPASESSPPPPPQSPPTPPSGFDPKKTAAQNKSTNPQDSSLLDSLSSKANPNAHLLSTGIKIGEERAEQKFATKLSQSYEAGVQDTKISQAEQDKNTAAKNALACKLGAALTAKKLKPKFEQKEQENRNLRSEVASKDKIIQQKDTALENKDIVIKNKDAALENKDAALENKDVEIKNKDVVIQDLEDKNKLFAHILSNFNEEQLQAAGITPEDVENLAKKSDAQKTEPQKDANEVINTASVAIADVTKKLEEQLGPEARQVLQQKRAELAEKNKTIADAEEKLTEEKAKSAKKDQQLEQKNSELKEKDKKIKVAEENKKEAQKNALEIKKIQEQMNALQETINILSIKNDANFEEKE